MGQGTPSVQKQYLLTFVPHGLAQGLAQDRGSISTAELMDAALCPCFPHDFLELEIKI